MSSSEQHSKTGRLPRAPYIDQLATWWERLRYTLWFVLPETLFLVSLSPAASYALLETAAQPSSKRLQLRHVFARGRRYYLSTLPKGGFRMVTTNKIPWYGRRTNAVTVLYAKFEAEATLPTRMLLTARFKTTYFLDIFFLPAFFTSMIVFMPWPIWTIIPLTLLLFGLSWVGHRSHAKLEAHEMLFFIEKALEDHLPEPPLALHSASADIVIDRQKDFPAVWEKFYEEKLSEN